MKLKQLLYAIACLLAVIVSSGVGCGGGSDALPTTPTPADDPVEAETKSMEVPPP